MEKYEKPVMEIVEFESDMIVTSNVTGVDSGDTGIGYGGGSSGGAR